MIVLCAWCEEAGTRTVINEPEPAVEIDLRNQRPASHGICGRHQRQLVRDIYKLSRNIRHAGRRDGQTPKSAHPSQAAADVYAA